jgi:hypothetical protein
MGADDRVFPEEAVDPAAPFDEVRDEPPANQVEDASPSKDAAKTFDKPEMPSDEATTKLKDHVARFKEAIPEYEGMSEQERGWMMLEASLRIMAGQSPDAITNIAKGLQGLGPAMMKDAKEKRAWNRQVDLSAAKYALESVAKDEAKADALAKEGRSLPYKLVALEDFLDPLTGDMVLEGQVYAATRAHINSGLLKQIPVTFSNVFASRAKAISTAAKSLLEQTAEAKKLNTIDYKEAKVINENLIAASESFVHASGGRSLIDGVIKQLALYPDDITGAKGAANKLWSDTLNFMGVRDKSRAYKTRELMEVDLKMAFQKLIPVALRKIQAGNSISNRDVKNLADAFIAGGFISQNQDGTFTVNVELAGKNPEVLVYQLQKTNAIFREAQNQSLITFDQELYNLSKAEPGRYDIRYFEPRLKRMGPALEKYRARQKSPTPTASSILNVSDYFDLSTGKLLKPLPRRTQ